jgi:hypothetical protein
MTASPKREKRLSKKRKRFQSKEERSLDVIKIIAHNIFKRTSYGLVFTQLQRHSIVTKSPSIQPGHPLRGFQDASSAQRRATQSRLGSYAGQAPPPLSEFHCLLLVLSPPSKFASSVAVLG